MSEFEIYRLRTAFEFAPYVIIATLVICYSLLTVAQSTDQAAVVWLILSNIQLLILVPLISITVPA